MMSLTFSLWKRRKQNIRTEDRSSLKNDKSSFAADMNDDSNQTDKKLIETVGHNVVQHCVHITAYDLKIRIKKYELSEWPTSLVNSQIVGLVIKLNSISRAISAADRWTGLTTATQTTTLACVLKHTAYGNIVCVRYVDPFKEPPSYEYRKIVWAEVEIH